MKKAIMYHGERLTGFADKIQQLFKSKDGKEIYFSGIKILWFGCVYEMENNTLKIRPQEIKATWDPTEKEKQEYEAQKIVVMQRRQARLKEMKIKRPHADIVKAVELIRPFTWHLSELDRRRFFEWFRNQCSKKAKKK